jgi:hypothetical protein
MSEKKVTKAEYDMQYAKDNLKRIPLDVKKGYYDIIKEHAETKGETVNGFIKRAISETMERDNGLWIKLPCHVGDPIYIIESKCIANQEPKEYDCDNMECEECQYDREKVIVERKATMQHLFAIATGYNDVWALGENVFLTMEEAEKAMEDMKEK